MEIYGEELAARIADLQASPASDEAATALKTLSSRVKALEQLVDLEVWDLVRAIANGSAYVEHARTGDYF